VVVERCVLHINRVCNGFDAGSRKTPGGQNAGGGIQNSLARLVGFSIQLTRNRSQSPSPTRLARALPENCSGVEFF
jgi:hypothetical protein